MRWWYSNLGHCPLRTQAPSPVVTLYSSSLPQLFLLPLSGLLFSTSLLTSPHPQLGLSYAFESLPIAQRLCIHHPSNGQKEGGCGIDSKGVSKFCLGVQPAGVFLNAHNFYVNNYIQMDKFSTLLSSNILLFLCSFTACGRDSHWTRHLTADIQLIKNRIL